MTCKHKTQGCLYPQGECLGVCLTKDKAQGLLLATELEFHGRYGYESEETAAKRRVHRNNKAALELRRLHAENQALRSCALKYLAWLNVKNPEKSLDTDLIDPEMQKA